MSGKRIPKRVQINGKWYDAREWFGKLELSEFMSPVKYTTNEPYAHVTNLYFVYDSNNNKVGEFHIDNRTCSGCVTNFEI